MTTTGQRTFRINKGHVAERKIRDEALLLPISSSVGELGTVYDLNSTATQIWDLAGQGLSEVEIVERIAGGHDAPREAVERDVHEILEHLLNLQMLLPA